MAYPSLYRYALASYLLRPDTAVHRYAVMVQQQISGGGGVRCPWLRGPCLELLGLAVAVQGRGVGSEILQWIAAQARRESSNVWVLVSSFNAPARTFYAR